MESGTEHKARKVSIRFKPVTKCTGQLWAWR